MDNSDQPNSILHVNQLQMYPIPTGDNTAPPPFPLLSGEGVQHQAHSVYGALVLTNYRLFIQLCDTQHHIPVGLLEVIEHRDLFYLHIGCKDARTYRLTFDNNETCLEWFGLLLKASSPPSHLEELFAFFFFVWSKQKKPQQEMVAKLELQRTLMYDEKSFNSEVDRLKFNLHGTWRISSINKNYKLCGSYPPHLLVPAYITDSDLETVAKFRSSRRIPAVVWRHVGNGAVIARCSQPEVGWLGWRSTEDEDLIKAISEACTQDRGPHTLYVSRSPGSVNSNSEESTHIQTDVDVVEKKKVLIMDARSYTTAVANRARGGGCEYPEYYPSCEIQFMNLANIHSIRKSFHALRQLCTSSADQTNWFGLLDGTRWLQHMSGLMRSAVTLVTAVERDARPVLVHCSDGWDRTPQIVALAELLLDPFYRTVDGFRILIEREWLAFGHKFADRCGHATGSEDQNERCPVFLQWLDCVHQLLLQFPCAFEFSHTYLVKLAQHTYSNLFGTFLCNTKQERERVYDTTFSVWLFLNTPSFRNHLYRPSASTKSQVLWPQYNVRDLKLWSEVYLGSLEMQSSGSNSSDSGTVACPGPPESMSQHMTKTRSYGDLPHASETGASNHIRRCSDPNIAVDSIKLSSLKLGESEDSEDGAPPQTNGVTNGRSTTPTNADFLCELDENDCKSDCIYKNTTATMQDDLNDILDKEAAVKDVDTGGQNYAVRSETIDVIEKTEDDACECNGDEKSKDFCLDCGNGMVDDVFDAVPLGARLRRDDVDESDGFRLPSPSTVSRPLAKNSDCEERFSSEMIRKDVVSRQNGGSELLYSVCLDKSQVIKSDINHNGDLRHDEFDSDTECTEPSDSKSENITVLCDMNLKRLAGNSVETSTETLVSENMCRTPSANGWESTFMYCNSSSLPKYQVNTALDDDGLIPLRSDVQERLWQIIEDHRRKVDALQRELHTYRQALIKQVCHKCNHNDGDRNDDTSSIVESVCSAGEGQASAVESLRSDMSWEAVDEGPSLLEGIPTLWVPDHAVSRCTGCGTEFWLGRRKHHCRNCGRIFCADCSENSTPLPSEQLYDPVRVCTSCYSKLRRRDCSDVLPEQCKHTTASSNNNPQQITASSN